MLCRALRHLGGAAPAGARIPRGLCARSGRTVLAAHLWAFHVPRVTLAQPVGSSRRRALAVALAPPACTARVAATRRQGCPASRVHSALAAARCRARASRGGTGLRGRWRPRVVLAHVPASPGRTAHLAALARSHRVSCVILGRFALGQMRRRRPARHPQTRTVAWAARVRGACCHAQRGCSARAGPRLQVRHARYIYTIQSSHSNRISNLWSTGCPASVTDACVVNTFLMDYR